MHWPIRRPSIWSVDAGGFGATLGPEDALRFARGEEIVSSTGVPAKLSRPLDWLVVTDHSDVAGTIFSIRDGDPEFIKVPQIKKILTHLRGNALCLDTVGLPKSRAPPQDDLFS